MNGEWRDTGTGRHAPNMNPANTDNVLGELPLSSREEAAVAIAAARVAQPGWADTPAPERGRLIARVQRLMAERAEDLARVLTREEGKILRESRGEVQRTLNILEFVAGEGLRLSGDTMPSEIGHTFAYTVREPIGVVGAITPWNFPVAIPCWKIAPALVAGNTVVFKPASLTPGTAEMVVAMFVDAGVPAGVLNLVYGSGSEVGTRSWRTPACARSRSPARTTSASRSTRARRPRGKRVQCEMGGKNPIVVLEDADLGMAVEATAQARSAPPGSAAPRRRERSSSTRSPTSSSSAWRRAREDRGGRRDGRIGRHGPLGRRGQIKTVLEFIGAGREEGAELVMAASR